MKTEHLLSLADIVLAAPLFGKRLRRKPGMRIRSHVDGKSWDDYPVIVLKSGQSCWVSVPRKQLNWAKSKLLSLKPDDLFDDSCLSSLYGDLSKYEILRSWHGVLDQECFAPARPVGDVNSLLINDIDVQRELCQEIENLPESEKVLLSYDDADSVFFVRSEGRIASVASTSDFNDLIPGVSVFTFPDFRGRKYGKQVVSAWVNHWLQRVSIVHYQTDPANNAAIRLAKSLGFVQYGVGVMLKNEENWDDPLAPEA